MPRSSDSASAPPFDLGKSYAIYANASLTAWGGNAVLGDDSLYHLYTSACVPLQVIRLIAAEGLSRRPPVGACRLFLGSGFRLGAHWNRLVETVKTRKKREKTGKKWARYGLKGVKDGS